MAMLTRFEIFAQASKRLRAEFEALSIVPHNALKGQEAERIVRDFLNGHLPKRFAAGAGFIVDPKDNVSRQTDVVIFDAFNCPVYRASDDAAIFPSNNVAAVVEVKSRLTKEEMADAWEKIETIKGLAKTKPPEGPTAFQAQTMGLLFAFGTDLSLSTLSTHYADLFRSRGIGRHIDVIVILDRALISLVAQVPGVGGWNFAYLEGLGGPAGEGSHLAISVAEFEEYTLDGFFRLLLPHLMFFRSMVDHPGFNWSSFPVEKKHPVLTYLTSFTVEKDPEIRELKLKKYAEEVRREFEKTPVPDESSNDC